MTIERHHQKDDAASTAVYSDCENYRYILTRTWGEHGKHVLFVMLNPSTATEIQNDPTVERCERRARALGFASFTVCNIFAYRATDPKVMRAQADPTGPENDASILAEAAKADTVICAWGTNGEHQNRGPEMETVLRGLNKPLYHLGLSKAGHPKHPLYIGYSVQPELW